MILGVSPVDWWVHVVSERGRCDYRKFVEYAAPIIQSMYENSSQESRDLAIAQVAETEGVKYLKNVR